MVEVSEVGGLYPLGRGACGFTFLPVLGKIGAGWEEGMSTSIRRRFRPTTGNWTSTEFAPMERITPVPQSGHLALVTAAPCIIAMGIT